jgi:hypothetical protein
MLLGADGRCGFSIGEHPKKSMPELSEVSSLQILQRIARGQVNRMQNWSPSQWSAINVNHFSEPGTIHSGKRSQWLVSVPRTR